MDILIPLGILFLALWLTFRSRKRRSQRDDTQRREGGADWGFTRSGQQDHLNRRREEDGG